MQVRVKKMSGVANKNRKNSDKKIIIRLNGGGQNG